MSPAELIKSVTGSNFESLIQDNDIVILDFWASWCAPCKQFKHIFERVAAQFDQVLFAQVNIEQEHELAEVFQIRSIPHLMVFKQGIVIYSESGSMPESTFKELVQQAIDADVSQIKAQIDKE